MCGLICLSAASSTLIPVILLIGEGLYCTVLGNKELFALVEVMIGARAFSKMELLALTDIMIPSEEFALGHTGEATVEAAAKRLYELYSPEVIVITQGKLGGYLYNGKEGIRYPVFPVVAVDSNGSGDVFHGAFAAAYVKGYDFEKCCYFSSAVSAIKCTGIGARESVPCFETVKKFLKEKNYEL